MCIRDSLIAKYNAKVLLFYQSKFEIGDDDTIAIKEIILQIKRTYLKNVVVFKQIYDLEKYAELIGLCDLIISTRAIAVVISIMKRVPVIGIDYALGKLKGFMELAKIEQYCVDWNNLDLDILKEKINLAIKNRLYLKRKLASISSILRKKAFLNAQLLLKLIMTKEKQT